MSPHGPEAELFWLPIIGPTAFLAARRVLQWIQAGYPEPTEIDVDSAQLADMLGVKTATLDRALRRLARYRLAAWDRESGVLVLQVSWPALAAHQAARLPDQAAAAWAGRVEALSA